MARRKNNDYYKWMLAAQGLSGLGKTFGDMAEKQDLETQQDVINYMMVGGKVPDSLKDVLGEDFEDLPSVDISGENPDVRTDQQGNVTAEGDIDPLARAQGNTLQVEPPAADKTADTALNPMAQAALNPAAQQKPQQMPYYDQYLTRYQRVQDKLPDDMRKKLAPKMTPIIASMMEQKERGETRKQERSEDMSYRTERASTEDAFREKNFAADEAWRANSLKMQRDELAARSAKEAREKILDTKFVTMEGEDGNPQQYMAWWVTDQQGNVEMKYKPLPGGMVVEEKKGLEDQLANIKAIESAEAAAKKELDANSNKIEKWATEKGIYGKDKESFKMSDLGSSPEKQKELTAEFNELFGDSGHSLKILINESKDTAGGPSIKEASVVFPMTEEGSKKIYNKHTSRVYETLENGRYRPKSTFYKKNKKDGEEQPQKPVNPGFNPVANSMITPDPNELNQQPGLPGQQAGAQQLTPAQREELKRKIIQMQQGQQP